MPSFRRPDDKDRNAWNVIAEALCTPKSFKIPEHAFLANNKKIRKVYWNFCHLYQATNEDYNNAFNPFLPDRPYHRGHLVESAIFPDMETAFTTFTPTNAVPQHRSFNSGAWAQLEKSVREFLEDVIPDKDAYVITGAKLNLT